MAAANASTASLCVLAPSAQSGCPVHRTHWFACVRRSTRRGGSRRRRSAASHSRRASMAASSSPASESSLSAASLSAADGGGGTGGAGMCAGGPAGQGVGVAAGVAAAWQRTAASCAESAGAASPISLPSFRPFPHAAPPVPTRVHCSHEPLLELCRVQRLGRRAAQLAGLVHRHKAARVGQHDRCVVLPARKRAVGAGQHPAAGQAGPMGPPSTGGLLHQEMHCGVPLATDADGSEVLPLRNPCPVDPDRQLTTAQSSAPPRCP